jgi:hypothetical protein
MKGYKKLTFILISRVVEDFHVPRIQFQSLQCRSKNSLVTFIVLVALAVIDEKAQEVAPFEPIRSRVLHWGHGSFRYHVVVEVVIVTVLG